jgi:hypothetical protein
MSHAATSAVLALALHFATLPGACAAESPEGPVEIDNGAVKARFTPGPHGIQQEYLARLGDRWVVVAASVSLPSASQLAGGLYDSSRDPDHRLIVSEWLTSVGKPQRAGSRLSIGLSGSQRGQDVELTVTLGEGQPLAHLEFAAKLKGRPPTLEYLLLPLEVRFEGKPDFAHAPGFEPTADSVMGDRVFHSPAVILQQGGLFAAAVPDLDLICDEVVYARDARQQTHPKVFAVPVDPARIAMPLALCLDVQAPGGRPVIGYGTMDWVVNQHVWFRHENSPGRMVWSLSRDTVRRGLDLFVQADAPVQRGYPIVAQHLWRRYGARSLQMPRPQALPFREYARVCYPAYDVYQGYDVVGTQGLNHRKLPDRPDLSSWQQWEQDGNRVGGYRLSAPQWYDLVAFAAWWNNANDALGMHFWGRRLYDPRLVEKSRRIVNLALSAPQKDGMFPSLYHLAQQRWIGSMWNFPATGYDPHRTGSYGDWNHGAYHTAAASATAGYLLAYRRACEDDPRILAFVQR